MKKLVCLCSFLFLNVFMSVICSSQVSVQPEIILKKYLEKFSVSSESESLGFYSVAGLKQTNMYSFAVEKLKDESLRKETYKRILKKLALQSDLDVTNLFEKYNCKGGANAETLKSFYSDLSSYSGLISNILGIAEKASNSYSKISDYKNLITGVSKADIKGMSNFASVLSIFQNSAIVIDQTNYLQQYYLLLTAASFDIGLQRMKELKSLKCITDQAFINALNETIEELQNYPKDFWEKLAATISDNKDVTFKGIESFFQVFNSSAQLYAQTLTAAESLSATAFLGWSSAAVAVISTIKMIKDWNQEWRDITLLGTIYTSLTQFGYSSMHYVDIVDFTQFMFLQKMAKCMENSNLVFWEYFKPDQKSVRLYVENDLGAITNAVVKKRVDSQLSCDNSDSFTDPRDGHVYKTVKIGDQVWMAENLAFKSLYGCFAYEGNTSFISKYGYLYDLKTAKEVCPSEWHLPGDIDWEILLKSLGITDKYFAENSYDIGSKLKSTAGWKNSGNGTNSSGFNAIPSGGGNSMSWIDTDEETSVPVTSPIGETACWWTSSMFWMGYEYIHLTYRDDLLWRGPAWPDNRYSVRCVSNSTDVMTESTDKKDIEDQIIELMGDEITISSEYPTKRDGVKFQYLDLNDDGIDEVIAWNFSKAGAQNGPAEIWQTNPLKKLTEEGIGGVPYIKPLGSRVNNYRDLELNYYVSGEAYDPEKKHKPMILRWNPEKYIYFVFQNGLEKNVPNPNLSGSSETRKVRVHVTDFYNSPLINITVFFLNGTHPQKKTTDNFGEVLFEASPGGVNKIAAADLSGINKYGVAARRDYTEMLSNLRIKLPHYPLSPSESAIMLDELISVLLDAQDIRVTLDKLKEAQSTGVLIPSLSTTLGTQGVFTVTPTIKDGHAGMILDGTLVNYLKGNLNCTSIRYGINYYSETDNMY